MNNTVIKPGLTVSDDMLTLANRALQQHAPDLPQLDWATFTDHSRWFLVPDTEGFGYKAEFVVERTEDRTIKFNRWMGPDLRAGQTPQPHDHPWIWFDAYVLSGGYEESRFERMMEGDKPVGVQRSTAEHKAGERNHIPKLTFHEVTDIEPDTLTMMLCAKGVKDDWGYIDPHTGVYTHHRELDDPHFMDKARPLNPHLKK